MKAVVLGLGLALLATAVPASAAFAQAPNTLTPAEKAGGWKLLVSTGLGGNWRTGRSLTIGAM